MSRHRPPALTPRRQPKSEGVPPLPTKEEILAFIASAKGKVGKREISRHFGLNQPAKLILKRVLKDMEVEGDLEKKRGTLVHTGALPPVIVADVFERDNLGDFICTPAEWGPDKGEPPRILLRAPRKSREAGPAPGLNDRVLIRIEERDDDEGPAYTGKLIKVLSHQAKRTVGVFRAHPAGGGRMIPIDRKARGEEIAILPDGVGEAVDGDLISVEVGRSARIGMKQGRVRERLGSTTSERAISLIAIYTHDIPNVFPEAALHEAERAQEATLKGREDWRDIPLVTIDPADAKDHDDAVQAQPDTEPGNEGGFILHVAIADVAAYVLPGSALDNEAINRGNSVYFPDRVVPMLPERISNELCSLKPGVNRAALGLRITIDKEGRKLEHSFHRVLIRSAAKLAYPQAQAAIDGKPDETTGPLLEPILRPLYAAYEALKIARSAREPLDLDLPERKLVLDRQGHVIDVVVPQRLDAHKLIEEFMILSNVCAAETLEKAHIPLLYRIHDNPSIEKMQVLRTFLETIAISLPKQGNVRPELFNRILERVKDGPNATLANEVILRSQAQAEYSPDNIGHFGLNLRRYAHFTSPIRRYADLIVHRGLIKALGLSHKGQNDGLPDISLNQMRDIGAQISVCERRAMAAERETTDRLIALFLSERVGESFKGRVAGVTRAGLFVKLDITGADGFIPAGTLGNDFFRHDEAAHALTGSRTGESYRLGDNVNVRLVEAQPMAGALRFEMLSEGRYVKVTRGKSRFKPLDERPKGNTFGKRNTSGRSGRNRPGARDE
jgi:ribonuclease R